MPELVRVTRGVWRPADCVADLAGRAAAVLSACPEGSVLSGFTAARLHGLWLPPTSSDEIEVILRRDIKSPPAHSGTRRAEVRGRRRVLCPDEITIVDGLPVTSEERTWLDLAQVLSMPDLIAAGDSALRGAATMPQLEVVVRRAGHRRGVVRARTGLPLLRPQSRSRPESHLRYALVSAGLPEPKINKAIYSDEGEWLAEPDLHYREAKLAIEYNGAVHARTDRMRRDITREVDVGMRGGWRTVTFGPAEVFGRPDVAAAYVAELRRSPRG